MFKKISAYLSETALRRPLIISGVAAVAAIFLITGYIKAREGEILKDSSPVHVVVAGGDINSGEMIDESSIREMIAPRKFIEPAAILSIKKAEGRVAAIKIDAGTQITENNTLEAGTAGALSGSLPAGRRAVALVLDEAAGLLNLLRAGDAVDVLATFDIGNSSQTRRMTMVVVPHARIIAVGKNRSDAKMTAITLAVSREDASKITFVRESGAIGLALCSASEGENDYEAAPITTSTITGGREDLIVPRADFREYRGKR